MLTAQRERRLARRAARGDREALRTLYEEYSRLMFTVAYRLLKSSADARDVLHDVFFRLPDGLRSFDGKKPLEPWLRRVTTRAALKQLQWRARRSEVPLSSDLVDEMTEGLPILDSIELERALSSLPEDLRTVVVLKEIAGYSHEEIGELLGVPPSTSAGRLYRARTLLRAALSTSREIYDAIRRV